MQGYRKTATVYEDKDEIIFSSSQLRCYTEGSFAVLSCCDLLQISDLTYLSESSTDIAGNHAMLKIVHWAHVKYNHRHALTSKALQEVVYTGFPVVQQMAHQPIIIVH